MSCKYFKFDKKMFYFPSFPGVVFLRVLIDKLGGLSTFCTLPLDRLFLNFTCK